MSADGTRVFFEAIQPLTADDTDAGKCFAGSSPCIDVYERADGVTRLVSAGDAEPVGANAFFAGASPDGRHVFFRSDGAFTAEDREGPGDCYSNSCEDIFERFDGTTRLVTTGPADPHHAEQFAIGPIPELFGTTADGGTAFFKTFVRLVPEDTDHCTDIYSRRSGVTELVSVGPKTGCDTSDLAFGGASADGSRVFFTSGQHLTADDTDSGCEYYDFDSDEGPFPIPCVDVFERQAGRTTLISKGPAGGSGPYRARFFGNSLDGTVVAFGTTEALVPEDRDQCINQPGFFGSGYIQGPGCDDVYLAKTAPPDCSKVKADVTSFWPPNGKLRPVTITGAVDFAGQPLLARITGVTQDEAGTGDAAPGSAPNVVLLRAARSGAGNGRVYRIAFTATDDVGESCGGTVKVGVPHGGSAQAIDSAPPSFPSL
jgi:hypothetical protein